MAAKEATVYIVDCGRTMGERSNGRAETNLDWALQYVWDSITTSVALGRKTVLAGVLGLRTDGTDNVMGEESYYQHITAFQELAQIQMPQLRELRRNLVVSNSNDGDAISAVVIAIQMIATTCKKNQYMRKIVLVTDARAAMDADELAGIIDKIKDDHIELVVLGVDFDDADYGFTEARKDRTKAENEATLRALCAECDGAFGTLAQAIDELGVPRLKQVRPTPSYKGFLTLGNPETYATALAVNVERYPKTMVAKAPSASRFVSKNDLAAAEATQSTGTLADEDAAPHGSSDGLAAVKNARTYQVDDERTPGGKRDVDVDELARGYEYGRTAVHISESDRNVTTYETQMGFDIVGFVDKNRYERYLDMSRANLIVAQKHNDKASMAVSSLIHALYELDSYAVARLVPKDNKEPKLLLLAPNIEPDFECLYDVELPFAEDVRSYRFPPLDRVMTVGGKELTVHRNLPSGELEEAMAAYVDGMDLSGFGRDYAGEPAEYMPPDETYSPGLHRINQVVQHRAVFPDAEPPPPYEILTRYSQPPAELVEKARGALDQVIRAADVKKVPPRARGKRYGRKETRKPLSDLDVDALLAQDPRRKRKRIDAQNAIPEFRQLLSHAEEVEQLHDACRQLQAIVCDWIRHSVGDSGYGRAMEGLSVMREEMTELEEPAPFNDFLKRLKRQLLDGELGGDRAEMWYKIRVGRLGLIQKKDCEVSDVTAEEAKTFMMAK